MIPTRNREAAIREALRQVVDPELDCNIVDLGLVYGLTIEDSRVTVTMTLTTPGCPMQEGITRGVKCALLSLEGVKDVEVHLVWDPPWTPGRITEQGREQVGLF